MGGLWRLHLRLYELRRLLLMLRLWSWNDHLEDCEAWQNWQRAQA